MARNRNIILRLLPLLLLLIVLRPGFAQMVVPDTSFGPGGMLRGKVIPGSSHNFTIHTMLVQKDGKILVAVREESTAGVHLVRYNGDGRYDNSFGKNGICKVPYYIRTISLLPDGKMLCTTYQELLRLKPSGEPDSSFGSNGTVTIPQLVNCAVLPDGKIIAANYDSKGISLRCFDAGGKPDKTFGQSGLVKFNWKAKWKKNYHEISVYSVFFSVTPGDEISMLASIDISSASRYRDFDRAALLLRYDAKGNNLFPDTAKQLPFDFKGTDMLRLPDGKLLVAGTSRNALDERVGALVRLTAGGEPDPGFGNAGRVLYSEVKTGGNDDRVYMHVQPDGRILLASRTFVFADYDAVLWCVNAGGSMDTGFAANGMITADQPGLPVAMAVQPDGKILIAGSNHEMQGDNRGIIDNFVLTRFIVVPASSNAAGKGVKKTK